MAGENPIKTVSFATIKEFFKALENREHVRLVKVADQGLLEPVKSGRSVVMQPMVRVVATAFDYKTNEILRWDDKLNIGSGTVGNDNATENGHRNDPTGIRTRDKIVLECQRLSLQVVRGEEWTSNDIIGTLAGIDPTSK